MSDEPRHDRGPTAAVVDGPDVGRPNASAGAGLAESDGARAAGSASCRVADLIAEARVRVRGMTFSDVPATCNPVFLTDAALAAYLADEVERLRADVDRLDHYVAHPGSVYDCGSGTWAAWAGAAWRYNLDFRTALDVARLATPTPAAPLPGECPHCDRFREQGKSDEYLAAMHGTDHANKNTPAAPGARGA